MDTTNPSQTAAVMTEADAAVQDAKTICAAFLRRVNLTPERPAYRVETAGGWQTVTWGDYGRQVRDAALGLVSLGMQPGSRLAVWGDTTPEWTILDLAVMALGGASAGIYQTNTPEQGAYIINDCGATVIVVDGEERLKKALAVRDETANVQCYITWGEGADPSRQIYSFQNLIERGREYAKDHESEYEDLIKEAKAEDTAVIIYTSGTTGPPKGAAMSHSNCLFTARMIADHMNFIGIDASMAYLPLSHVAEHVVSFFTRIYVGSEGIFCPDISRLAEVMKETGPTMIGGVPRVFEKIHTAVITKVESAPPFRKRLFNWAIKQGAQVAELKYEKNEPVPAMLQLSHALADRLVLSKIREAFGGNARFCVCGAAPIDIDIIKFFNAVGVPFLEVYGMTETSGVSHANRLEPGKYRPGTVGTVVMETECKLGEDGEILVRGPGVFQGYLNKPEATAETIDEDGWLHTGDIGQIDEDGFLTITDRKKNLIITAGGKNVAPSNIEILINRDPIISQVVVLGDRRPYLVALVTLSSEELEKSSLTFEDGKQRVQKAVQDANQELARYEQIKYFEVLEREFLVEEGEITPTLKLKRNVIKDRYSDLIEGMYAKHQPSSESASDAEG